MPDETTTKRAAKKSGSNEEPASINDRQMRQMHALLHQHGYVDRADVHELMTVHLGREITTAKELTVAEAADFIAWLSEQSRTVTPALVARLRAPFADEEIGKLPRSTCKACSDNRGECPQHPRKARCSICGNVHNVESSMHLDYVGHADVTARLLEVDPFWTWRPFTAEEIAGIAPSLRDGGIWIMLTVAGVTRPGFGDADGKRGGNAVKEMIGDALRNAAMRFGVALDLWAKGDRTWMTTEKDDDNPTTEPGRDYNGPSTEQLLEQLAIIAQAESTDLAGITAKWRERNGGIPVEALSGLAPVTIGPLVQSIEQYLAQRDAQREAQPA